MGNSESYAHMNLKHMSILSQVQSSDQILKVITMYLEDIEWDRAHPNEGEDDDEEGDHTYYSEDESLDNPPRRKIVKGDPLPNLGMTEEELEADTIEFKCRSCPVHPEHLEQILKRLKFHAADIDIINNIYLTQDIKGTNNASIRDVLCMYSPVATKDLADCLQLACTMFDLDDTKTVGYGVLLHIFKLLMDGVDMFGDKTVSYTHLIDVTNSVFTMEGKLGGFIAYEEYIPHIVVHPVAVLFASHQFQGISREKYRLQIEYEKALKDNTQRPRWRGQLLIKTDADEEVEFEREEYERERAYDAIGIRWDF
jgi:hypothetical protein